MIRSFFVITIGSVLLTPLAILFTGVSGAQVMEGTQYRIESDSINFGGGFSASDSYTLKDTLGEVATGESASDSFALRAGYRQLQAVAISISAPQSIEMDPAIPGIGGGFSNGSTSVTVITDNPAGYELLISAENSPAMQGPNAATIGDYEEVGAADYEFATSSSMSHLGLSVVGVDAAARFLHDGSSVCGSGSTNTPLRCWVGLRTTLATIARNNNSNHPAGTETLINFRVGVGGAIAQPPGVYVATTTVTALPL